MGVTLPSSPNAARSLLRWIGRGGEEAGTRIAILKAAERDLVGKRVRHKGNGRCGKVRWIVFRELELRVTAIRNSPGHVYTHPLDANIEWDDGEKTATSIGSLEVIPDV